jgi:hypothetical protein
MRPKILQISKNVYEYYRTKVRGNQRASSELIQKKLTRNVHLALKVEVDEKRTLYMYGNLHIWVRGNKIYHIRNVKNNGDWFYKDMKKYEELNELLGINKLEAQPHLENLAV